MADDDLLDWDDDDINDIEASDETDEDLDGGLRITDAPGHERSVRLWRVFLHHRRPILGARSS